MRNKFFLIILILVFNGCAFWQLPMRQTLVEKVRLRGIKTVTALAIEGDNLYLGGTDVREKTRLVLYHPSSRSERDLTQQFNIGQNPPSQIFISQNKIYLITNNNFKLGEVYSLAGRKVQRRKGDFLSRWLKRHQQLKRCCSKETLFDYVENKTSVYLAYFKNRAYEYNKQYKRCFEVFTPPSIYEWPVDLDLDSEYLAIATQGAGGIIVRLKGNKHFFLDREYLSEMTSLKAIVLGEKEIFFGTEEGLFKIERGKLKQIFLD